MTRVAEVAVALRCTMLRQLERRDAPRYTEFRACCDTGAETIATLCSTVGAPSNHRTADGNVLDGLRNGKGPEEFASVHRLRSKLRGSVRRLAEPEEAYWNAAEHAGAPAHSRSDALQGRHNNFHHLCHAEAAQELCSSAQALVAAQGSAGAGALAAAVAAQLLTTVFDDLADTGYVAHKDRLLDILQVRDAQPIAQSIARPEVHLCFMRSTPCASGIAVALYRKKCALAWVSSDTQRARCWRGRTCGSIYSRATSVCWRAPATF